MPKGRSDPGPKLHHEQQRLIWAWWLGGCRRSLCQLGRNLGREVRRLGGLLCDLGEVGRVVFGEEKSVENYLDSM